MTNPYLSNLVYILFLGAVMINSCHCQISTNSTNEASKPIEVLPEILKTPAATNTPNPYNDPSLVGQYIRCIFQDSKGHYWFGPAGQSVAKYDGDTLQYISRAAFFQGNDKVATDSWHSVHAIAEDKAGNVWFGTDIGLIKYDGTKFRSYTEKNGLSNSNISRKSIFVDQSGTVWVGTQGGVFRYIPSADNADGQCFRSFELLPPVNVKDIMEDSKGNIWFASANKGVFRYDGTSIKNITEKEGLGDSYAGGIVQDKAGNYWFTMKDGICRYDGKTFTTYKKEDGLGGREIWGIYMEKSGIIWITARGSTTRFDPSLPNSEAFRVFTVEDGINCCVQSMYQDKSGNMWWGAGQGLYQFDGNRFYQVKKKDLANIKR